MGCCASVDGRSKQRGSNYSADGRGSPVPPQQATSGSSSGGDGGGALDSSSGSVTQVTAFHNNSSFGRMSYRSGSGGDDTSSGGGKYRRGSLDSGVQRHSLDSGVQRHSLTSRSSHMLTPGMGGLTPAANSGLGGSFSFSRYGSGESPASRYSAMSGNNRSPMIPGFVDETKSNQTMECPSRGAISGGASVDEPGNPLWWQNCNFVAPSSQQEISSHRRPDVPEQADIESHRTNGSELEGRPPHRSDTGPPLILRKTSTPTPSS